jgi:glucose-1-phosphate cytidylyltransferase
MSDVTFDLKNNCMEVHEKHAEPWRVTIVDTGEETQTGGRLKRVRSYLKNETFCFTYGDGLADVDIRDSLEFHRAHGKHATITAVQPPGRYGALQIEEETVRDFHEKPLGDGAWINGGFFVLEPSVIDRIADDATIWEREPMEGLAHDGQLVAYKHHGFWRPMDTLRDKSQLEELWLSGKAPWKVWDEGKGRIG